MCRLLRNRGRGFRYGYAVSGVTFSASSTSANEARISGQSIPGEVGASNSLGGTKLAAPYFGRALLGKRPDLPNGGLHLPLPEGGGPRMSHKVRLRVIVLPRVRVRGIRPRHRPVRREAVAT